MWSQGALLLFLYEVSIVVILLFKKIINARYLKRLSMQGREREIDTLSVQRPQPHTTNL